MTTQQFQARWISKKKADEVRKTGALRKGVLLDSFNGIIIVEPVGSNLGDGDVMPPETADYELRPVWCYGSKSKLTEARKLLDLDLEPASSTKLAETLEVA